MVHLPANAQTQAGATLTPWEESAGKHSRYLLGWAAAIGFSPPARRRGGVRDGASCTPQKQGHYGGHHTNAGGPAWLCTGLALLKKT